MITVISYRLFYDCKLKFSGFISYSHEDGTDLASDLFDYLSKSSLNFQPIYDKQIAKGGEKIEKILEKIPQCDILIVIITPAAIQSKEIKKEVELAKKLDLKIIPCNNTCLRRDWPELPWGIGRYIGPKFTNPYELKRELFGRLSESIQELEKSNTTKIQSSTKATSESLSLVIRTDKSAYIKNSDMICTVINFHPTSLEPIFIKIFDEFKNKIYQQIFEVIPDGDGVYQDRIRLGGDGWPTDAVSELTIIAEHGDKTTKQIFFLSDFSAVIALDQKIYTCTDKVRIRIVAPDLSKDPNKVRKIGNNDDGIITIKTGMEHVENYELIETGPNTGIFTGEIHLTGFQHNKFPSHTVNDFGQTSGKGPKEGRIGADSDDKITIEFKTKTETIAASALIRWNIGEVQWMQPNYSLGDTGTFIVIEPDMNLDSDLNDTFKVRVWSKSDPVGTEISVIETGRKTGIFSGYIQFGTKTVEGKMIKVSMGDFVKAEYIDYTLPIPYSKEDELGITGTCFIGPLDPLQRIIIENPRLVDSSGNIVKRISPNQEIQIIADLTSNQNFDQKFSYIVEIKNSDGNQIFLEDISGSILSNQSLVPALSWTPSTTGRYVATIYVWESMYDPTAFSSPVIIEIIVN